MRHEIYPLTTLLLDTVEITFDGRWLKYFLVVLKANEIREMLCNA